MRRRVQALVRTAARMQQHGDEASGRLSATEAALERAVSEEERLRAAVEEEARLRAAAEEEARQLRAAAEEEEVSAQHYRRLAGFAWMAVAAISVMLGMVILAN